MAKKSLNMIEKLMDPNIIDYHIINCAIPLIITIENCYQIDFGKPGENNGAQLDLNAYTSSCVTFLCLQFTSLLIVLSRLMR